ncbi:MAG: transposase [Chlorobi bacterium]|nr:transposase [Chlorobiota bacterium]
MSTGYKISEKEGIYFLTFQIVGWADIFTRKIYKDIVIDSFKYCQKHKGLEIFAYVIMSNHIHILCRSNIGDLSGTIRDFKIFTSKKFIEILSSNKESRRDWMNMVFKYHAKYKKGQNYQIWTHENHAEHIFSQKFIEQKINYIHQNPVRSGIVNQAENYNYSSAKNYADEDGLLDVITIDFLWKTVR